MDFQKEKQLVLDYYKALETGDIAQSLGQYTALDWQWRGYHPFHELRGAQAVASNFWAPFTNAFTNIQRRQDIFFAGYNQIDDFQSVWVVSMGHLIGLFDAPFLGIPATGKMGFLRYAEFNKVENAKITETAFYFDLPHLMVQAGLAPFASQRGAQLVQPGPVTHDGLLIADADGAQGKETLALINKMISDLGTWNTKLSLEDELRQTWAEDMIWWGPTGIGATYTIERYAKQHSGPFRATFHNRSGTGHICRLAEGNFGGFFGWPNFTASLREEYLGIPPSDIKGEFRVIDIYRRQGGKLTENWVFIDIPYWMHQHGVDILDLP